MSGVTFTFTKDLWLQLVDGGGGKYKYTLLALHTVLIVTPAVYPHFNDFTGKLNFRY